jgi:hypothetical protein
MKYFIGIFIGLTVLMLLFLAVGKFYDSDVDTFQVKEKKQVKEKPIEEKKLVPPHKVVKKVLPPKPLPKKKEKVDKKIPKDVRIYLQDDTLEVKENMTLVQVDKIWGTPTEVERTYDEIIGVTGLNLKVYFFIKQ